MIVYLITNMANGRRYVGQTVKTLKRRWIEHTSSSRRGSPCLVHRAIHKYGPDVFTCKEVGTYSTKQDLDAAEQAAICAFNAHWWSGGYNLTWGGEGASGRVLSEKARRRISEAHTGRSLTAETCRKMSDTRKGRAWSEARRAAQSTLIPSCHPDRKHCASGLCRSCYKKLWEQKAVF